MKLRKEELREIFKEVIAEFFSETLNTLLDEKLSAIRGPDGNISIEDVVENKVETKCESLTQRITVLERSLQEAEASIKALQISVHEANRSANHLEQHGRRLALRIHQLPAPAGKPWGKILRP